MQACLVLLLALAVAEASSVAASKRGETLRNIELLSRRSALDKNFMRFGRAGADNYLRFGKAADGFMRFGRAPNNDNANFIRFGRSGPDTNFMRFGRPSSGAGGEDVRPAAPPVGVLGAPMVRLGRPSAGLDNNNFMRFGRGEEEENEDVQQGS